MIDSEIQHAIERMTAHAERLVERINNVNGEGYDDHGMVRVTCAPGGRMLDIELDPETRRMQTLELRKAILTAVERAALAADDNMRAAVSAFGEIPSDVTGQGLVRQAQARVSQYTKVVEQQMERIQQLRTGLT